MIGLHEQLETALAGRYQIERELGRGGMAIVYLARDLKHARRVAVKVLRPELATSLGAERFLREINVAAGLNHPNIVALYDSGEADDLLYYVMPFVEGESLRDRLERERQLPIDEALGIARQVAAALDYAHAQRVVHRDIKPENILLRGDHVLVADFGLAAALHTAASPRLTKSGTAVGTPAYMSPEQASADRHVDARTDVYSLGCVVFEMIAGMPPFRGATAQAVIAHHVATAPPSLRGERQSCPETVDAAVRRAMAKVPADRFRTAGEFVRCFVLPVGGSAPPPRPDVRSQVFRRRLVAALGATAGVAILAASYFLGHEPALDASRYAVLPFVSSAEGGATTTRSGQVAEQLSQALAEWQGIRLVDRQRARDELGEQRRALRTKEALRIARGLGAGRLAWGDVSTTDDSVIVRASLYDVVQGNELRRYAITYAQAGADPVQQFRELASALVRGRIELPWKDPTDRRPASLAAWTAYDAGRRALGAWDFEAASRHFRAANAIDAEHVQAQYWLAHVLTWDQDRSVRERGPGVLEERRLAASRATALAGRLGRSERMLAAATVALAEGRYADACRSYREALDGEANEFAAWYGLGECQSRDSIVLRDARSASGYRFRSSFHAAAQAYVRATELLPPPHPGFPYHRLSEILLAEANRLRWGRGFDGRDSIDFAAYPSAVRDTLAFVPFPVAAFSRGWPGVVPTTRDRALELNRARMRRILSHWVSTSPQSTEAHESLAAVLETLGSITEGDEGRSALSETRRARRLVRDSTTALRLARNELRLLLKSEEFPAAKRVADSLLAASRDPRSADSPWLVGSAALTGRMRRTRDLLASPAALGVHGPVKPDGRPLELPPTLVREWAIAVADASLGACTDHVRGLEQRIDRLLESYVADATQRGATRDALLERPLSLAVPCLGAPAVGRIRSPANRLVRMQQMLARNELAALRAQFDTLRVLRAKDRPGDIAIDHTYLEAWLLAAAGDTTAAIKRLDLVLAAPALLGRLLVYDAPHAGGFVRAMALRAELGARTGDSGAARRWGHAVAALWADADPELQSVVSRMRMLSTTRTNESGNAGSALARRRT